MKEWMNSSCRSYWEGARCLLVCRRSWTGRIHRMRSLSCTPSSTKQVSRERRPNWLGYRTGTSCAPGRPSWLETRWISCVAEPYHHKASHHTLISETDSVHWSKYTLTWMGTYNSGFLSTSTQLHYPKTAPASFSFFFFFGLCVI
jgi:hypothetical protein